MRRSVGVPDEMGVEGRMIASVHVADVGARSALGALRTTPRPASTPGLRHATIALAAPLGGSVRPAPDLGRVGWGAFWDHDDAPDPFQADHPPPTPPVSCARGPPAP